LLNFIFDVSNKITNIRVFKYEFFLPIIYWIQGDMGITNWNIVSGLLDILFPPFCLVCDNRLSSLEKAICVPCWSTIQPTNLGNWMNRVTIHSDLNCVYTGWFLDDVFQELIHKFKYQEKRIVAIELGKRLADLFGKPLRRMDLDVIIPVPLHPAKLRERGFNQSDILGRTVSSHLGIPFKPRLLRRKKKTQSQTTLSVSERLDNVAGAFIAKDLNQYRRFLVIDDVLTTGATLSSCAKALRNKGAKYIAVVVAGTPRIAV